MSKRLTHINQSGEAMMVDVSAKEPMRRVARAAGMFHAKESTIDAIFDGTLPKGEAISVARIAGIQAAKLCETLIPLCHPLPLDFANVMFERKDHTTIKILSEAIITSRTGVEMEALTAVSIAALTLWDMTKAIDDTLVIENIELVEKTKEKVI